MEVFKPEDTVRLLPCKHCFHAECIDRCFQQKAYQQRSCPLCKADPLQGQDLRPTAADMNARIEMSPAGDLRIADLERAVGELERVSELERAVRAAEASGGRAEVTSDFALAAAEVAAGRERQARREASRDRQRAASAEPNV